MKVDLKFGGSERQFLFTTWIARKLTDNKPDELLEKFQKIPLQTWQEVAFESLKEGKNDLPEGYGIREFLIDFDDAEDKVRDQIREGVKRCINPFGDQGLKDQFIELFRRMDEEDREFVKKTANEGLEVKNPNGVKEIHPA